MSEIFNVTHLRPVLHTGSSDLKVNKSFPKRH